MSWDPETLAKAIAVALGDVGPEVNVFAFPVESMNPPALVVGDPDTVELETPTFKTDTVNIPVVGFAGMGQSVELGRLLARARSAVEADRTFAGVARTTRVVRYRSWRVLNVAGADLLAADLLLEVLA